MKNYKIIIQYDGTKYDGWQKQGNTKNTIQGKFEAILSKLVGREIEVHGSGRTDAGTHALGQVANFKISTSLSECELMKHLNEHLPMDIGVVSCKIVDYRFHSRLNAKEKTYRYRIWNSEKHNVFEKNYLFLTPENLDVEKMKEASKLFIGEHDFKAFCSNKKYKKSTIRHIYDIKIEKFGEEIRLEFVGNGFLYNMVRILVGTLIEIGEGKREISSIKDALEIKERELAGFTAPACGLVLVEVIY